MLVPAADAIERAGKALDDKTNTSLESRLMKKIKTQATGDFYSYQGIFVATPSGKLLAGTHHDARDVRKVEKLLREGLEKWKTTSPADRLMTEDVFSVAVAELAKEEGRIVDVPKLQNIMKEKDVLIDGGYGKLKGLAFRLSNMGDETEETMGNLISKLDASMEELS